MESYIHLYKTNEEFTAAYNSPNYKEPWLSLTEQNMTISYSKILTAITFNSITWVTDVPAKGGTATKDNCEFKVYANYDNGSFLDISSGATVTGTLVVPSSTEGQRHEAGQLTLTASYSGFTATGNVTAYQEAVPDFSTEPLTFKILSDGTINWTASNTSIAKTIDYKLNDGEWTSITSNTDSSAPTINVVEGDKIQFRGNNATYSSVNGWNVLYNSFSGSTALFEAEGNAMSLIYGDDFKNNLTISSTYVFYGLFRGCTKLVSAENLILPATTLTENCYQGMFQDCKSLTTAPALPASTLKIGCYSYMFYGCTSLTTAPELPATTLAEGCYNYMFRDCTKLTTAPELSVTKLASNCYYGMFQGCTSLTTAPALPATTLKDSCYSDMFYGTNVLPDCSNIDFASSTVVASGGLKGLFSGTKVTDNDLERLLPKNDNGRYYLPATTLANYCYSSMFYRCTSLTTAPELPATTLAQNCYSEMFYGCTSLINAPKLPATTLAQNCYDGMFKSCSSLKTAPALPADKLYNYCYESMFEGCDSLTTAPVLPAATLAMGCYASMFKGCGSLTTAPVLPAATLAYQCYHSMFESCEKLNYIKCLATDISASYCTNSWVFGVASKGTFVKAASMTRWAPGSDGIPSNWTVQDA